MAGLATVGDTGNNTGEFGNDMTTDIVSVPGVGTSLLVCPQSLKVEKPLNTAWTPVFISSWSGCT